MPLVYSLATLAALGLAAGGGFLLLVRRQRRQGGLMLLAAAVLLFNIWSWSTLGAAG